MSRKVWVAGLCLLVLSLTSASFAEEVFVTANGKKFHQETCRLLKKGAAQAIDDAAALEQGYQPCKVCLKEYPQISHQGDKADVKITKSKKEKNK